MARIRRALLLCGLATAVAGATLVSEVATTFAYGAADQPLAQVEVSANCDNPSFPLCAPFPAGVGTGGIWYWVELDANGTGDLSGAACGHTVGGVGGPGGAGAGSIKGSATWKYTSLETAPPGAIFFGTFDPKDKYYAVTITDGSTWLIPTTTGHYSARLAAGVQLQITVAP
ncbi:MAG TPA: hypothetical protein VFL27_01175 [Candidatus Dormibacteraeota bacterium]|nr:hypothetical protein [Candidatus Dormibacteraeota bacterium]